MTLITSDFLKHKAREISYALNRVSFYIKRDDLRNRIERLSFELLENAAIASEDALDKPSLVRVFKNLSALDVLVRIGHSLYEIETINSNILVRELDAFNSAIRQFAGANSAMENSSEFGKPNSANQFAGRELNLESMFSMTPTVIQQGASRAIKESVQNPVIKNVSAGDRNKNESGNEKGASHLIKTDPLTPSDLPIQLGSVINQSIRSTVQSATRTEDKKNSELSVKQIAGSVGKDFANIDNEKEIVERAYSEIDSGIDERENSNMGMNGTVRNGSNLKKEVDNSVSTGQAIIKKFQNGISQQVRDESGNRTIRQNLISEKIRQSGKANVKELISQFPGVSERTIRYDLQKLCDQGVVEKNGSSGPGTSYSPKLPNP